jgi:hypothetical protein
MEMLLRARTMSGEQFSSLAREDPGVAESVRGALPEARQMPFLSRFAQLSPEQRQHVYEGGHVRVSIAQLAGNQSPAAVLRDIVGGNEGGCSGQGNILFFMPGPGPLQRLFCTGLTDDPLQRGASMWGGVEVNHLFPDLAPARQQQAWREWFGEPASADDQQVAVYLPDERQERELPILLGDELLHGMPLRREVMETIAHHAEVNLIADDMGQSVELHFFPATGSVAALLDQVCLPHPAAGTGQNEHHGSFWRRMGETYLVRSLSWPEEETRLIPYERLKRWREAERQHGHVPLDVIAEMAILPPDQVVQLSREYPQLSERMEGIRAPLRCYSRASPALRKRLQTAPGVPVAELGIRDDDWVRQGVEPLGMTSPKAELLRQCPPDRLYLILREETTDLGMGRALPALYVSLQEQRHGHPYGHPYAFRLPLVNGDGWSAPPPRET